ncbi:monooxygenase family protein, partial [Pseudomonas sp. SIMBA_041]
MDESFVVFIIGMRINRLLAVHKWVPVAKAMGGML